MAVERRPSMYPHVPHNVEVGNKEQARLLASCLFCIEMRQDLYQQGRGRGGRVYAGLLARVFRSGLKLERVYRPPLSRWSLGVWGRWQRWSRSCVRSLSRGIQLETCCPIESELNRLSDLRSLSPYRELASF